MLGKEIYTTLPIFLLKSKTADPVFLKNFASYKKYIIFLFAWGRYKIDF